MLRADDQKLLKSLAGQSYIGRRGLGESPPLHSGQLLFSQQSGQLAKRHLFFDILIFYKEFIGSKNLLIPREHLSSPALHSSKRSVSVGYMCDMMPVPLGHWWRPKKAQKTHFPLDDSTANTR